MTASRRYWAALVVWALTGCATPLPENIAAPRVSIVNVDVVGLTVLEQRYRLSLRLQNPNAFALPVNGLSVSFSINGEDVGEGVSDAPFSLPAMGQVVRDVDVTSDLSRLAHALRPRQQARPPAAEFRLRGQLALAGRVQPIAFEYGGSVIDP